MNYRKKQIIDSLTSTSVANGGHAIANGNGDVVVKATKEG